MASPLDVVRTTGLLSFLITGATPVLPDVQPRGRSFLSFPAILQESLQIGCPQKLSTLAGTGFLCKAFHTSGLSFLFPLKLLSEN